MTTTPSIVKDKIPQLILENLAINQEYSRKVLPFIHAEYFTDKIECEIFKIVRDFILKYNNLPTKDALRIILGSEKSIKLSDEQITKAKEYIEGFSVPEPNTDWLIDKTEGFCKDQALYNALVESIALTNNDSGKERDKIPSILTEALGVSFNSKLGHNYLDDSELRYQEYHREESHLSSDIEMLNRITRGGFTDKTLNIFMGGTNVGKSLVLCHLAGSYLSQGYDGIYYTMEMSEHEVATRIDANLLDIPIEELAKIPKNMYDQKIAFLRSKTPGKLYIQEYPTASASVIHFKAHLNELYLKKKFKPRFIIVDYLNICASSRVKLGNASGGMYQYVKLVSEELRGLAIELSVPLITATQTNRTGFVDSDPELDSISESFGTGMTADFLCSITTSEELEKMNQYMLKQLKNRYNTKAKDKRFMVGVDYSKMRIYNLASPTTGVINTRGNQQQQTAQPVIKSITGKSTNPDRFSVFKN